MTIGSKRMLAAIAQAALVAQLAACGAGGGIGIVADDNNPQALRAALATASAPASARPVNVTGKPLAFLVVRDKQRMLAAFDLEAKRELWRVPTEVASKVMVGRDFVAHAEGKNRLVGRDLETGRELWSHSLSGEFIGAAADETSVYVTVKESPNERRLRALDGRTGSTRWTIAAMGALGAPAARGGLVFSPYLKQWLEVLDARTGKRLTRIRGVDEEITFVRATTDNVCFGSSAGVFLLDERAASGKRAQSTYGKASLPTEFIRVHYDWDAFDPIQSGYSAYDRNRILWRAVAQGDQLGFAEDRVVVHHFRFFFGFNAKTGALDWAYSHPRADVVASAHVGPAIVFVSLAGQLGALDPVSGRRVYAADMKGQVLGATFDAEGWAPTDAAAESGERTGTAAALGAIARDRDARFNDVKKFAVAALAKLPGAEVTSDLLALIQNEQTPPFLYEAAVEALVSRKDPGGLADLAKALEQRYDFIAGTAPRHLAVIADAIAGLRGKELDATQRGSAVEGLLAHLSSPQTPADDLGRLVGALGAIGGGAEIGPLRSFVLAYRADPAFSENVAALGLAIDVLLQNGGAAEYELVAYVAGEARTQPAVAEYAVQALSQLGKTR